MDAHARARAERRAEQVIPRVELIKRVATLVDNTVKARKQVVRMIVRSNADIALVEARSERVLHLADGTAGAVDRHHLHNVIRKLPLFPDRELLLQEGSVDLPAPLRDGMDDRKELCADVRKISVQRLHREALFILVKQRVIGRKFRAHIAGKAPLIVDQLRKVRLKGGIVVCRLCLVPHAGGFALRHLIGNELLHGDLLHALHVLGKLLRLAARHIVKRGPVFKQRFEHFPEFRRGREPVAFLAQHADCATKAFPARFGHDGLRIVIQHAERVFVCVHFRKVRLKAPDRLFHEVPPYIIL